MSGTMMVLVLRVSSAEMKVGSLTRAGDNATEIASIVLHFSSTAEVRVEMQYICNERAAVQVEDFNQGERHKVKNG
jgi:phosphate uptake regulator